ncbi:MAG: MFS transporter [Phycisphaerae bacterium]
MSTLTMDYASRAGGASGTAKYQVLVGALIIQLILGTIYGYSIFWEPLDRAVWPPVSIQENAAAGVPLTAGTLVVASEAEAKQVQDIRRKYLTYSFAICLLSFSVTMIFAGRLQDVVGPRWTAMMGGVLMGGGFLVSGQMNHLVDAADGRLLILWLTIGLLAGAGIGFAYVCPIAALVKWFPRHKGLMSGIAVAGFGLGAYIFSQRTSIGAAGYITRKSILDLFNLHAIICMIAIGSGALLLRNPPAGYAPPALKKGGGGLDLTWRQTLRTGRFYVIWLMFFSGSMAGLMVIGVLKPFAGEQLVEAARQAGAALTLDLQKSLLAEGAAAVGILSVFNAAGRVFWGLLSDRIGRTASLMCMYGLQGVTMLSLTALDTSLALKVGAASVGFNYGGCFALFPSLTADLFGSKNLGANYGWVFTSYGVAGVAGIYVGGTALVMFGSYFNAFALASGMCFLSVALAVILGRMVRQSMAVQTEPAQAMAAASK